MLSWLLSWVLRLLGLKATTPDSDTAQSNNSAPSTPAPAPANVSPAPVEGPVKGPPAAANAPPVVGPPQSDRLGNGDAYVEFGGTQRSAKNVNFTQKADAALTARMHDMQATGKAVNQRFLGEESADVRFKNANIHATEEDLNMFIKGGKSRWITGQTAANINRMNRAVLLQIWETYRNSGRNESVKDMTVDMLRSGYEDTEEGLAGLREFIVGYLAVTNGEDAG